MSTEQTPCDCITAPCGCLYIGDTSTVDHTYECRQRQADERRAREAAAGYAAFGQFLIANPQLKATSGHSRRYFMTLGSDARQQIEEFVVAATAAEWEPEPYEANGYAGVQVRVHGLTIAVYAPIGDLAEPPGSRKKKYRPLIAPAALSAGDPDA